MTEKTSIDSLVFELGDCGLFQILMVIFVHGSVVSSQWSQTFMSYGNYNPGSTCNDALYNSKVILENKTVTPILSCDMYQDCADVIYSNSSSTIVTEWNLACGKSWITSLMLSVQSGGFIIGSFGAGVLNNSLGRKPTHYGGLALLAVFNLIAAFSVNWPMFTVMRFFIGIMCGSVGLTNFVYPMEFVTDRWRAVVSALPFSSCGGILFALVAMHIRDWRLLHLATATLTAVMFLPMFCAPESVRWLVVKGKTDKAMKVINQISKVNRKKPIDLEVIYDLVDEQKVEQKNRNSSYTIFDLFRDGFAVRTSAMTFTWITVTICSILVIYNIKSLSGDFYLNQVFFNMFPAIGLLFVPLFCNTIGRKLTTLTLFGVSCVCCTGLLVSHYVSIGHYQGLFTLILSLVFISAIGAVWAVIMLYSVEMYPTTLRSLSYSFGTCAAMIVGMFASFLIPHDEQSTFLARIVMFFLTFVSFLLGFLFPETKGQILYETLSQSDL